MSAVDAPAPIRSTIPARLDRLGWSPFHTRLVAGLGAAWILDGLQITIAGSVTGVLIQPDTLRPPRPSPSRTARRHPGDSLGQL